MKTIQEVLSSLEPTNEDHWTGDGLPRVDIVSALLGKQVQRAEVTAAAPQFTRANPVVELPPVQEQGTTPIVQQPAPPVGADAGDDKSDVVDVSGELAKLTAAIGTDELYPATDADAARANAREAIKELEEELVSMDRAQTQLTQARDRVVKDLDAARVQLEKLSPQERPGKTIQNYLESQKRIAQEKAAARRQVLQTGLRPGMFSAEAPIDTAIRNTKKVRTM